MIRQTIHLTLNGKPREVAATSLPALLEELGVNRKLVAVAHNGEVIPRGQYDGIILNDGDHVEVVRMVGGG